MTAGIFIAATRKPMPPRKSSKSPHPGAEPPVPQDSDLESANEVDSNGTRGASLPRRGEMAFDISSGSGAMDLGESAVLNLDGAPVIEVVPPGRSDHGESASGNWGLISKSSMKRIRTEEKKARLATGSLPKTPKSKGPRKDRLSTVDGESPRFHIGASAKRVRAFQRELSPKIYAPRVAHINRVAQAEPVDSEVEDPVGSPLPVVTGKKMSGSSNDSHRDKRSLDDALSAINEQCRGAGDGHASRRVHRRDSGVGDGHARRCVHQRDFMSSSGNSTAEHAYADPSVDLDARSAAESGSEAESVDSEDTTERDDSDASAAGGASFRGTSKVNEKRGALDRGESRLRGTLAVPVRGETEDLVANQNSIGEPRATDEASFRGASKANEKRGASDRGESRLRGTIAVPVRGETENLVANQNSIGEPRATDDASFRGATKANERKGASDRGESRL